MMCFSKKGLLIVMLSSVVFCSQAAEYSVDSSDDPQYLQENSVVTTAEFKLQDPVAFVAGEPVALQDFLDFIEGGVDRRPLSYPSKEILEEAIISYYLHQLFVARAIEMGLDDDTLQLELNVEKRKILAQLMLENMTPAIEAEIDELFLIAPPSYDEEEYLYYISKEYPKSILARIEEDQAMRTQSIEAYQRFLLMAEFAKKMALDQSDQYQLRVKLLESSHLSNRYLEEYVARVPYEDAEIEEAFIAWAETQNYAEFKVSHIYFLEESIAKEVLGKLKSLEITFEEAVKEYSQDPATVTNNGAINAGGWTKFPNLNHPFTKAVLTLEIGEISSEIIQNNEGYHIALLHDKRAGEIPDYEKTVEMKFKIWQQAVLKKLFSDVIKNAEIEINTK